MQSALIYQRLESKIQCISISIHTLYYSELTLTLTKLSIKTLKIYIYMYVRGALCNECYRRKIEFKMLLKLFAFHFTLISL